MKPPVSYAKIRQAVSTRNPFVHSSTMFRKDAVFKIGLYDENFNYSQDYELWSRFLLFYKGKNLKAFLHYWRKHDTGSSVTDSERQKLLGDAAVGRYVELFRILNSNELAPPHRAEEFVKRLIKRKDILKRGGIILLLCNYILDSKLALGKKGHYLDSLHRIFPDVVMNWFNAVLENENVDAAIHRWIRYRMAGILYDRKKFQESKELFLSILKGKERKFVNPGEIYFYLGNIYKMENNREWRTYLSKWVAYSREKRRKSTAEIYRLGGMLHQLGRLRESANWFKRVLKKKDAHKDMMTSTNIYLGDIFYQLEKGRYKIHYAEALKILKSKRKKSDLDVYRTASLYKRLGDWDRAARWFNKLLAKPKSDLLAGAYFHLAEIALARKDKGAGRRLLEKCLSLNPGHIKAKEYIDQ
jgi:tetratricopeptide (TPR) repeat protein